MVVNRCSRPFDKWFISFWTPWNRSASFWSHFEQINVVPDPTAGSTPSFQSGDLVPTWQHFVWTLLVPLACLCPVFPKVYQYYCTSSSSSNFRRFPIFSDRFRIFQSYYVTSHFNLRSSSRPRARWPGHNQCKQCFPHKKFSIAIINHSCEKIGFFSLRFISFMNNIDGKLCEAPAWDEVSQHLVWNRVLMFPTTAVGGVMHARHRWEGGISQLVYDCLGWNDTIFTML